MILLNGCSFSDGTALKDIKYAYPNLLSDMLDEEIIDLSEESKNNFYMAFELNNWILHKHHNDEELPRIIIWQHTDCFRNHFPVYKSSGTWQPNNLKSLIGRLDSNPDTAFGKRHVKIAIFATWNKIKNEVKQTEATQGSEDLEQLWGVGTILSRRVQGKGRRRVDGKYVSVSSVKDTRICDGEFVVQFLQHAINVYNLQVLCNTLNIKLINYNYYPFGPKFSQDPIIQQLDKKSFVLGDPVDNMGMYNHLLWKGFTKPDQFHFNEAAHLYQAEVLYDYIVNDNQLEVEQEGFLNTQDGRFPIFDYGSELDNFDYERRNLLKAIYDI